MIRLVLQHGDGRMSVDVPDGKYVIGRDNRADILVPNKTVSSRHAEIEVKGHRCTIRDVGSSNGTTVNGQPLLGTRDISSRDDVRLGSAALKIEDLEPGAAAPAGPLLVLQGRRHLSWAASLFIAAAIPMLLMCAILIGVEVYSAKTQRRSAEVARFRFLAAQYAEPLRPRVPDPMPAPVLDENLAQPVLVADASGKVLYPPGTTTSPLIDPKTRTVYPGARSGLFAVTAGGVRALSYPVIANGDLLGYVIARPADVPNDLGVSILTIVITAAVALAIVYFTQKRLVEDMLREVETSDGSSDSVK
jgi:hypothetical protein